MCDITKVINETPVLTSWLPPPSVSNPLSLLSHCSSEIVTVLSLFSVGSWRLLSNPVDLPDFAAFLYPSSFELRFSYICLLIWPFLLPLRSAVSVYVLVPGVVWTGQACMLSFLVPEM